MIEKVNVQELVIDGKTYVPKETVFKKDGCIDSILGMIGKNYFLRTVTYSFIGNVVNIIDGKWLVIKGSSCIYNTPRFYNFIKNGELNEVEHIGDHYINIETIVDFIPWVHPLPQDQK